MLTFDAALRAWIVTHRSPMLDGGMSLLSEIGRLGAVWIVLACVMLAFRRVKPLGALHVAAAVLSASALTEVVLKPLFDRDRPFLGSPEIALLDHRPVSTSFPSGHAATSVAGALVLTELAAAWWPLWWGLAAGIAYSRIYVGVHYPLDVLGGAVVGLLCAVIISKLFPRSLDP